MQKGVNYATQAATQELQIFDEDGNFSLAKIIKQAMSGKLSGMFKGQQTVQGPNQNFKNPYV